MVIGMIKENPQNPFEEDEIPAWKYFHNDKPIELLGRLYDRGYHYEDEAKEVKLTDLYLAKKQIKYPGPEGSESWASVEWTARDVTSGKSKYESYDGNTLHYHIPDEKEMMWLQDTEVDVVITQKHLAQQSLERWDSD